MNGMKIEFDVLYLSRVLKIYKLKETINIVGLFQVQVYLPMATLSS